jgi:hypothetical protein
MQNLTNSTFQRGLNIDFFEIKFYKISLRFKNKLFNTFKADNFKTIYSKIKENHEKIPGIAFLFIIFWLIFFSDYLILLLLLAIPVSMYILPFLSIGIIELLGLIIVILLYLVFFFLNKLIIFLIE